MQADVIIEKINASTKIEDVISIKNFKTEFNNIVKEIHPDICRSSGAADAMSKMNIWKDLFENGKTYKDDVCTFKTNGYWADFKSDSDNLKWSVENFNLFKELKGNDNEHFQKYIPASCDKLPDGTFRFHFEKRAIPLSGLNLPQEHVNWILNRLLEYSAYLAQTGFSHCGINPESVFIVPETHGIQVCSFYHLTRIGNKIGTISGKYTNWYPQEIFNTKIATQEIDIEASKKIAAYLLGDTSGSGIKLRKTHNEDFINFIISSSGNAYQTLSLYRDLLKKNFKKEFHSLTI